MTEKWLGKWPTTCEILECGTNLSKEPFFVDGKTIVGPWALMCPQCFLNLGIGLGTGRGQMYDPITLEKWRDDE